MKLMSMSCFLEKECGVTCGCPQSGAIGPPIIYISDDDGDEEENRIVKSRSVCGKRFMRLNSSEITDVEGICVLLHKTSTV